MEREQLEKRMEELKQVFDMYNNQIQETTQQAQLQVDNIIEEANKIIEDLKNKMEQARGAYTEIYYMLNPEEKPITQIETSTQEPEGLRTEETTINLEDIPVEEAVTVSTQEVEEQTAQVHNGESILTEEQLEAASKLVERYKDRVYETTAQEEQTSAPEKEEEKSKPEKIVPQTVQKVGKIREEDIPDYLKEEYNKK